MTLDQGHGRHDTRQVLLFAVTPEETGFPHAKQGALVIRTTHHLKEVKVTQDTQFTISSRDPKLLRPPQFLKTLRGHWSIENQLHYVRDVTLGEDQSTARTGHSQQNLATIRNVVIGLSALAEQQQSSGRTYLPGFRRKAQNHRDRMLRMMTRPLSESFP